MTITWENVLRFFYHLTTGVMFLGVIILISENDTDIYQIWVLGAMIVGSYLIEKK